MIENLFKPSSSTTLFPIVTVTKPDLGILTWLHIDDLLVKTNGTKRDHLDKPRPVPTIIKAMLFYYKDIAALEDDNDNHDIETVTISQKQLAGTDNLELETSTDLDKAK
ncbi:hypothetical protein ACTA71_004721 [Dictyostelium dimigraforme]